MIVQIRKLHINVNVIVRNATFLSVCLVISKGVHRVQDTHFSTRSQSIWHAINVAVNEGIVK